MNIGIIGMGKQGRKHLRALKTLSNIKILVSDENLQLAKDVADASGALAVKEVYGVKAVFICTPVGSHYRLIEKALGRKMHVFCEKPLCEGLEPAKVLEMMMLEANRFIQVGFVYRYAPLFKEAYKMINESNVLGEIQFALFRLGGRGGHQEWKHKKEKGGGVVNEMLVHMVDLALWFFGPLTATQLIQNKIKLKERAINGVGAACDAEDFVFLKCESHRGVDIYIESDFITPAFSQYVEVQGTNGSFFGSIQPDVPSYLYLKEARGGYEAGKTVFNFGKRNFFDAQVTDFIFSVAVNKWPEINTVNDSILLMEFLKRANLEEV